MNLIMICQFLSQMFTLSSIVICSVYASVYCSNCCCWQYWS